MEQACLKVRVSFKPRTMTGWWNTYPAEKYEFVSWDGMIIQYIVENKIHV
jgi:hypothetical protein